MTDGLDKTIELRELCTEVRRYSAMSGALRSAVRVFRSKPGRVEVQIRAAKAFATASLDKNEARKFAVALLEQIETIKD